MKSYRYCEPLLKPFLGLCIFALISACGGKPRPITKQFTPTQQTKICRVAFFPFTDTTTSSRLALKAERIFFSELVNLPLFEVALEGDVKLFFKRNRILPGTVFTTPQLITAQQQLDVDAVIIGRINDSGQAGGGRHNMANFISIQVDLLSTHSGKKLASTFLRRAGSDYQKIIHFGTVSTESGLLEHMAREIFEQWQHHNLGGC